MALALSSLQKWREVNTFRPHAPTWTETCGNMLSWVKSNPRPPVLGADAVPFVPVCTAVADNLWVCVVGFDTV